MHSESGSLASVAGSRHLRSRELGRPATTPWFSAVLTAMALLVVAACTASVGTDKTVDTTSIEARIATDVKASRGVEVKVRCPGEVKAEKGGKFTCQATDGEGNSLPVLATQNNDSGDISWELQAFNIPKVEQELTESISQELGTTVEVDCPAALVDSHRGEQIECAVTDQEGGAATVVATAVDDEGNISWELNTDSGSG